MELIRQSPLIKKDGSRHSAAELEDEKIFAFLFCASLENRAEKQTLTQLKTFYQTIKQSNKSLVVVIISTVAIAKGDGLSRILEKLHEDWFAVPPDDSHTEKLSNDLLIYKTPQLVVTTWSGRIITPEGDLSISIPNPLYVYKIWETWLSNAAELPFTDFRDPEYPTCRRRSSSFTRRSAVFQGGHRESLTPSGHGSTGGTVESLPLTIPDVRPASADGGKPSPASPEGDSSQNRRESVVSSQTPIIKHDLTPQQSSSSAEPHTLLINFERQYLPTPEQPKTMAPPSTRPSTTEEKPTNTLPAPVRSRPTAIDDLKQKQQVAGVTESHSQRRIVARGGLGQIKEEKPPSPVPHQDFRTILVPAADNMRCFCLSDNTGGDPSKTKSDDSARSPPTSGRPSVVTIDSKGQPTTVTLDNTGRPWTVTLDEPGQSSTVALDSTGRPWTVTMDDQDQQCPSICVQLRNASPPPMDQTLHSAPKNPSAASPITVEPSDETIQKTTGNTTQATDSLQDQSSSANTGQGGTSQIGDDIHSSESSHEEPSSSSNESSASNA